MKIVYLIGNGFDLNIGMKTSYPDFYKFYLNSHNGNEEGIIKKFIKDIQDNPKNWSDLEHELGKFIKEVEPQNAIILHDDLIEKLSKFIQLEEEKYVINDTQKEPLLNYLKNPFFNYGFLKNEIDQIKGLIGTYGLNQDWDIKIMTFNYTKTIERMIGKFDEPILIGNCENNKIYLTEIEHIHGFSDERMVLGVNDDSQIANENLRTETRVIDRYVKPNCNNTYGNDIDEKCQQWLEKANIVCLFGLSYGITDKKWWNKLAVTFVNGGKILVFEHYEGERPNANQGPARKDIINNIKTKILSRMDKTDLDLLNTMKNSLFVTYADGFFKFDIVTKEVYNSRF